MKESHAAFFARGRASAVEADEPDEAASGAAYVVPAAWTPEHVGVRMIHACKVIESTVGVPRPRAEHTAWPEVIGGWRGLLSLEEQDYVIDLERQKRARRKVRGPLDPRKIDWRFYVPPDLVSAIESDAAEAAARRPDRVTDVEIAFADEAIHWPMRFLADEPLWADALMVWAWTKAAKRSLEKLLRARNKRVEALIERRFADLDAPRRAIAAEALAWGKRQTATPDIVARIQRRCVDNLRAAGLEALTPRPTAADVAPGQCYTRKAVDTFRAKAMSRIARALRDERRPVR